MYRVDTLERISWNLSFNFNMQIYPLSHYEICMRSRMKEPWSNWSLHPSEERSEFYSVNANAIALNMRGDGRKFLVTIIDCQGESKYHGKEKVTKFSLYGFHIINFHFAFSSKWKFYFIIFLKILLILSTESLSSCHYCAVSDNFHKKKWNNSLTTFLS